MVNTQEILKEIRTTVLGWIAGSGMRTETAAISNPPTAGQIGAAFGGVGPGFRGLLQDAAQAHTYLCVFDGANWWYQELAKAG